jgi:hypothetical protein
LGSRGHSACDIFSRKVCRGPGAQRVWRTLALPTSVHDQSTSNANTWFPHGSFSIRYCALCRQSRDKCNSPLQQRHTNLHARRDNSVFGRIQEHWSQRYRNWS